MSILTNKNFIPIEHAHNDAIEGVHRQELFDWLSKREMCLPDSIQKIHYLMTPNEINSEEPIHSHVVTTTPKFKNGVLEAYVIAYKDVEDFSPIKLYDGNFSAAVEYNVKSGLFKPVGITKELAENEKVEGFKNIKKQKYFESTLIKINHILKVLENSSVDIDKNPFLGNLDHEIAKYGLRLENNENVYTILRSNNLPEIKNILEKIKQQIIIELGKLLPNLDKAKDVESVVDYVCTSILRSEATCSSINKSSKKLL